MSPLSADDLARLRELTEAHQSISPQLATDLLDTVDQLRSLLAEAQIWLTAEARGAVTAKRGPLDLSAAIDAALSAEPASTD